MRSASLERNGKETHEVVLILPVAEACLLVEMAEAAVRANPRKGTFKKMLRQLHEVACF